MGSNDDRLIRKWCSCYVLVIKRLLLLRSSRSFHFSDPAKPMSSIYPDLNLLLKGAPPLTGAPFFGAVVNYTFWARNSGYESRLQTGFWEMMEFYLGRNGKFRDEKSNLVEKRMWDVDRISFILILSQRRRKKKKLSPRERESWGKWRKLEKLVWLRRMGCGLQ